MKASGERYVPEQGSQQPLLSLGMVGGPLKSKFPEARQPCRQIFLRRAVAGLLRELCPAQWCGYILEKGSP